LPQGPENLFRNPHKVKFPVEKNSSRLKRGKASKDSSEKSNSLNRIHCICGINLSVKTDILFIDFDASLNLILPSFFQLSLSSKTPFFTPFCPLLPFISPLDPFKEPSPIFFKGEIFSHKEPPKPPKHRLESPQ